MYRTLKNYIKISLKLFIRNPISLFSIWYDFFKEFFLIKTELEKSKEKIKEFVLRVGISPLRYLIKIQNII